MVEPHHRTDMVSKSETNIKKLFGKRIKVMIEDPVIVNYLIKKCAMTRWANIKS
jgi:hypothetical protein